MGNDYTPEADDGVSIAGESAISCDLWIRKEDVGDMDATVARLAVPLQNARTGSTVMIPMARATPHHLVVPRHMPGISAGDSPRVFTHTAEKAPFQDGITLRDSQVEAWKALSSSTHGVLNLACGLGKTVLGLKRIALGGTPAVVVVNNVGLIEQWSDRAVEHLGLARADIGVVQGKKAQWDRPLVLAMVHTLANVADSLPMDIRRRFGTAVFDEAHHLPAVTFLRSANLFYGDRFGLTATTEREDGLERICFAHLGDVFHTDLRGDLDALVYFRRMRTRLPPDADIYDTTGQVSMGKLHIAMANHPERNWEIVKAVGSALSSGRKVLALTHSAEHPELLKTLFDSSTYGKQFTSGAISGKTDGGGRSRALGACDVTFATFGIAREGLDERRLDTVFFLTPFKAWGGFQQGKGRVERRAPGKLAPIAVVLEDPYVPMAPAMCASLRRKIKQNGIKVRNV